MEEQTSQQNQPEQSVGQTKQPKPSSASKFLKYVISAILMIIGVVVIIWFFIQIYSGKEVDMSQNFLKINNRVVSNTNTATNQTIDNEAIKRDEQRISDIKKIQQALADYKKDKGNYPEKMEELVSSKYLSELLKNPTPGGIDYVYTPIGSLPAQYYDLAYSLEVGTDEVKEPGDHIANPDGIAYP